MTKSILSALFGTIIRSVITGFILFLILVLIAQTTQYKPVVALFLSVTFIVYSIYGYVAKFPVYPSELAFKEERKEEYWGLWYFLIQVPWCLVFCYVIYRSIIGDI